ncbi:MAG: N4-(beta-N-acetylglucosaminyl)-L-asparaginase [Planctomycetes bacterium]|nr:N4-(beta-N-acetylglucosaminyl)-L-asparaginase [Planctomycetota bacterium]
MQPVVIATWKFGEIAARAALPLLVQGQSALDAALAGAQAVEDDPSVSSVGFGGLANSVGAVSLDACVMDGRTLNCGAVAGVENIRHVAALARRVMETTPHLLLVGEGAKLFAVQQGFPLECLHTPESVAAWEKRLSQKQADHLTHDTVTALTLDRAGSLGGVCTTSGLSHKLPGRVGDSPIISAGLYVDNSAGAAGGTGVGEEILRIGASLIMVEAMRAGKSPQEACELVTRRVIDVAQRRNVKPAHVAFIALDPHGNHGAACTAGTNFHYALGKSSTIEVRQAIEIHEGHQGR